MKNKLQSRLLLIALLAGSLHVVCSNLAYGEEEVKTCYGACGSPANVSAGSTKCCPFPGGAYNCIKDDQECASGSGIGPGENDPCFKGFCSGNTDLTKCCAGEQGNLYCIKPSEECNEDDTSTTIEGAPFPATIEPNTRETNDQEKGKKKKKSKKKPRGKKDKEVLYGSANSTCWSNSDCPKCQYCDRLPPFAGTCVDRNCGGGTPCPLGCNCINGKCTTLYTCPSTTDPAQCTGSCIISTNPTTYGICGITGSFQCICHSVNDYCKTKNPNCYSVPDPSSCTGTVSSYLYYDPATGELVTKYCCCPGGTCKVDADCGVPLQDNTNCTRKKCINFHCQTLSYCTGDKKCCDGGGSCITCGCERDSDCHDKVNCRWGTCVPSGGNKVCQYPDKSYCCSTCSSANCQDCGAEFCCNDDGSGSCKPCGISTGDSITVPEEE